MVDWMSMAEIQRDEGSFIRLMHVLCGLYIWEFLTSLDFEWSFITGRKKFRWPIIFYFLGRYSLLGAMIGIVISFNVTGQVDCQALYLFNQLVGNATIGFASVNLALRTMAVWEQRWYIVWPLVAIMAGQWALLLDGTLLTAVWEAGVGCVIVKTKSSTIAAGFLYTMCFDALIMFLTGYKLATTGGIGRGQRSKLVSLIFTDGLIYFIIAFLANLLATTFMFMNLNPIMSIIFNVPAAIVSTIVASRAVRRLSNFLAVGPERFGANKSSIAFRTPTARSDFDTRAGAPGSKGSGTITVPMDTFTQASDPEFAKSEISDLEAQTERKDWGPEAL